MDVFEDEKTLLRLEFELRIVQPLAQDSNKEINYLFEVTITVLLSGHVLTKAIIHGFRGKLNAVHPDVLFNP